MKWTPYHLWDPFPEACVGGRKHMAISPLSRELAERRQRESTHSSEKPGFTLSVFYVLLYKELLPLSKKKDSLKN